MVTARSVPPPTLRCESPPPNLAPTPAPGAIPELSRCFSAASSASHGSSTTDSARLRESVGSDGSGLSCASSASFTPNQTASLPNFSRRLDGLTVNTSGPPLNYRQSTGSFDAIAGPASARTSAATRRRGYMRPQGTDFAASARSRESVLSLGSIAHLQYYFARTGLLDGKGGQLARKRQLKAHTLDFSALDPSSFLVPKAASDHDSSYASLGSSPDLTPHPFSPSGGGSVVVESPIEQGQQEGQQEEDFGWEDWEDPDPNMLPPTASTYMHREKPVPKPPTIEELKDDLTSALKNAKKSLREARDFYRDRAAATAAAGGASPLPSPTASPAPPHHRKKSSVTMGWYEIQGMHLLDVVTLAIRAAKIYYTAHDEPERLSSIKPERELRSDLLTVMDVLRKMATRGFAGGMRPDEFDAMDGWISRVRDVLRAEEKIEAEEAAERKGWTWLDDAHPDWQQSGREGEYAREEAFMRAMLAGCPDPIPGMEPLPKWIPMDRSQILPPKSQKTDSRPGEEVTAGVVTTSSTPISAAAAARETATTPTTTTMTTTTAEERAAGPPTAFLAALRSGVRLVQLHNCAVRRSRRRFGQVSAFNSDTQKPYRAADNLRYWAKAAELRWEALPPGRSVLLAPNTALALQHDAPLRLWAELEDAVLNWCRVVRGEITAAVGIQEDKEKARRLHQAQKSISSVMGQ